MGELSKPPLCVASRSGNVIKLMSNAEKHFWCQVIIDNALKTENPHMIESAISVCIKHGAHDLVAGLKR